MNKRKNKIVATIEARMTSSRLPGKVLMPSNGIPMLKHLTDRLKTVSSIDEIVIATTINETDNEIVSFANNENVKYFRGSEDDVMLRVVEAAKHHGADVIVEITGDCPIIDPQIIEQTIQIYLANNADYVSNCHIRSYPVGMDTQVFSLAVLEKSLTMTKNALDHEHVTLHIRNNPDIFSHIHILAPPEIEYPDLGLTLDEKDDYSLINNIIEHFGASDRFFTCLDVIKLLSQNKDWIKINQNVHRKGDH